MDPRELILRLLAIPGETRDIEFKRLGGSKNTSIDRTLESIVAMANTDGGLVVLGIDDPEKTQLKGLDRVFGIEENLVLYDELGKCVTKILPPIASIWPPQLINLTEKGRRVGLLSVPKVTDGLRSIENHVYIRGEKGNKRLSPQEVIHFAYIKGFQHADIEMVDVPFHLLATSYFESWRRKRGFKEDSVENILEKTGLARQDGLGPLRPTRAAVMLFAEHPTDLMDTKCTVRIFEYIGKRESIEETLNLIGTPLTISGPISKQIQETHQHVLGLLRTGIRVPSGFVTQYRIPERAVKEAITNAVIHRDYHTKRDIEIRIFEDRIEIESPGLLPFNITPANIGMERAHGYRNDLLVKHLREFPDPPNLDQNEGVRAMRETMAKANLYPPVFTTYPTVSDGVRVTLLNETAPSEWDKISHHLSANPFMANKDARKVLGIESEVKMSKMLRRWVRQGLLIKLVPRGGAKQYIRYRLPVSNERYLFTGSQSK